MNNNKYSVIILAAGRSNRMGSPKFAMVFNDKRTFLDEIIDRYNSFGCKDIVVVLNRDGITYLQKQKKKFPENVILTENTHLEWERFYSIKTAVLSLKNKFPVFIHNVDNPFVNHNVLKKLLTFSISDYVVPAYKNHGGHPVLLSPVVCEKIATEKQNDIVFSEFLKRFNKTKIEVNDKNILVNINTKEDYRTYIPS